MKSSIYIYLMAGSLTAALVTSSCRKELPTRTSYDSYTYAGLDESGGTWTPVWLAGPEEVRIDPPAAVGTDAYRQELAELKRLSARPEKRDREAMAYWTNNPIIRWNEIARDMVAKYNLTPAPAPDGTYPSPDPAQPDQYPYFPYSHPTYTCRALSYLGAAQFDALIAAWHYKYEYSRPAPYLVDETLEPAYATNDLPSYPSDGAVVAAVSREILSTLFPLEKAYLEERAEEMKRAMQAAGMHVASDLAAGDSLGRGVARLFLARAAADGMSAAQVSKAVSDSLAQAAYDRFGWKWENMEVPQRPVGVTPFFGRVKTWFLPDVEAVRAPVPPAPGTPAFAEAVAELRSVAENLTTEQRRIANWWSDGLNTYTPPGHWNRFATDFILQYRYNPLRSARVYAYMNMAIHDAGVSCWDAKYYYHYPRPIQVIDGFKTILGTPNFPAYTSGHSSFSAAAAAVLAHIFPAERAKVDAWAWEAAESRIYGGIHFRFDSEAGLDAGRATADYAIMRAAADGADQ
ncbi:MAG: hypothetical protein RLY31_2176 [Bacteroidota bacterium]|jgi:hypothetical protein